MESNMLYEGYIYFFFIEDKIDMSLIIILTRCIIIAHNFLFIHTKLFFKIILINSQIIFSYIIYSCLWKIN